MPRPPITARVTAYTEEVYTGGRQMGGYQSWFPHRMDGPSKIAWSDHGIRDCFRLTWAWLAVGKSEVYRESGRYGGSSYYWEHPDPQKLLYEEGGHGQPAENND